MFLLFRKKTLIIISAVLCGVIALSCVVVNATSVSVNTNGKKIVLDAGHGGIDGGVEGVNTKVKESDVNLAIVKRLKRFLISGGYKVVLTRSNANGLYGLNEGNRKARDMQARKKIIDASNADLMVSVHCNSYPLSSVSGAQVFYDANSAIGNEIANVVQGVLNSSIQQNKQAKSADYYVLQCSTVPSILVECGFLSNPHEESLLITSEYQEKIAYYLYTGIVTALS